jgi:trehalose synthase
MTWAATAAVLRAIGLADGRARRHARYMRLDGSPGRVDRRATLWQDEALAMDVPTVVHVSRWDRLKDPLGTITAFERYVAPATGAP